MSVPARSPLAEIIPYKAGESRLPGYAKPIKLASNENPLGCSPAARAAMAEAAASIHLYPDGSAQALREQLAARHGLEAERIICGAGSDEIFQLLARAYLDAGDQIVVTQYAFLVYELVAMQSGARTVKVPDRGFTADVDGLIAAGQTARIVFLANPNNPTGTLVPASEVRRLHAGLPGHVMLVLDAAYAEYVDDPGYADGLELAQGARNVVVTHTFSKIHGLAGARLGWAYGPLEVIDALNRVRGPFNVSALALAAGAASLADPEFLERSRTHNREERARLADALRQKGLAPIESHGNFLLVPFPLEAGSTAADADAFLRSRGVIVRRMDSYKIPQALRVSVGLREENDAFLAALDDFLAAS